MGSVLLVDETRTPRDEIWSDKMVLAMVFNDTFNNISGIS